MIVAFANQTVELVPEGALWFPEQKLLCASDLHFEKGSFFARLANFLPPYDSEETLRKLEKLILRYRPDIFIAVGDSFHDKGAAERMQPETLQALNALVDTVPQWYWLAGNHDVALPPSVKGLAAEELTYGGVIFRHQTSNNDEAEISGHYHPKARFYIFKYYVSAPCFVRHRNRIILPAFGHYTGGLDVNSEAFQAVAPKDGRELFLIHQQSIFLRRDI